MRNPFKRETLDDLEFYDDEYEDEDFDSFPEQKIEEKEPEFEEMYDDISDYDEPQILKTYSEEEFEEDQNSRKKYKKYKKIINIVFAIILVVLVMITIDVISVSRYNVGPFFAIKTQTIKDGGTKVYYGLGYKVIKYNQEQGRRDREIGSWNLKYNIEPVDIQDIDLALEFENNYQETNKKYYKKFVRLTSTVKEINKEENTLVLEYLDEDSKYTLDIVCNMAEKKSNLEIFNVGDKASVIGTIRTFKIKTAKESNKVYISDCFAESYENAELVDFED